MILLKIFPQPLEWGPAAHRLGLFRGSRMLWNSPWFLVLFRLHPCLIVAVPPPCPQAQKTCHFLHPFCRRDFVQIFFIYGFHYQHFRLPYAQRCFFFVEFFSHTFHHLIFLWLYSQPGSCFPRSFLTRYSGSFFGVLVQVSILLILTRWLYLGAVLVFHASCVTELGFMHLGLVLWVFYVSYILSVRSPFKFKWDSDVVELKYIIQEPVPQSWSSGCCWRCIVPWVDH